MRWSPVLGLLLALASCGDRGGLNPGGPDDGGAAGGQTGGGQGGTGGGCPLVGCAANCPLGYQIDANGCSTCICKQACPHTVCPAIACPNGLEIDANGCNTCRCKTGPVCPPVNCPALACPYGTQTDANGCTTCGCRTTCAPLACFLYCPSGFQHDAAGCAVCACNDPSACTPDACGPQVPLPQPLCDGGRAPVTGCRRTPSGSCAWTVQCPGPCAGGVDPASCASLPACAWLDPGCANPLPSSGCYERSLIGCADRGNVCPAGKTCQLRTIRECMAPTGGTAAAADTGGTSKIAPPGSGDVAAPICRSCPQPLSICL